MTTQHPETLALHAGWRADPATGSVAVPIDQTTAYQFDSPEHAADNAGAGTLRLTDAELARIDAAFPLGPRPRRLPML